MDGDVDIAFVAALMGQPARAAVLIALSDGRALAASTLATEAHVAPSTISEHLSRLIDGGLLTVELSGRHRYFRIASPEVAQALEALAYLAPTRRVVSLGQSTHAEAIRRARTCYDHLAGRLGVALCDALVATSVLQIEDNPKACQDPILGSGRVHRYMLSESGRERLGVLGVFIDRSGRRPLTRYCLD